MTWLKSHKWCLVGFRSIPDPFRTDPGKTPESSKFWTPVYMPYCVCPIWTIFSSLPLLGPYIRLSDCCFILAPNRRFWPEKCPPIRSSAPQQNWQISCIKHYISWEDTTPDEHPAAHINISFCTLSILCITSLNSFFLAACLFAAPYLAKSNLFLWALPGVLNTPGLSLLGWSINV